MRETAFQAYKALYDFGLVNDNLLPLTEQPELQPEKFPSLPPKMGVSEQYDPWVDLAHSWSMPDIHQHRISVRQNGALVEDLSMALTVPASLPALGPLTLFWDQENTFTVSFAAAERAPVTWESVKCMRAITTAYLQAASRMMVNAKTDFVEIGRAHV